MNFNLNNLINSGLFNPKVTNSMAALDDQTSMFSVAARDAVGSSGRIGMEYQRDKHGGRERLLEEALTLAIWGFGVRAIKQVYDASMLGAMKGWGVKLPDLDTGMLPADITKASKPGSQVLTKALVDQFADTCKNNTQYAELQKILDAVKNPALKRTYQMSSIAKFGAASILPAAAIAFAVPTLNQWLTRQLITKEDNAKQISIKPASSAVAGQPTQSKRTANPWGTPMAKTSWATAPGLNHLAPSSPAPNGKPQNAPTPAIMASPQLFGTNAATNAGQAFSAHAGAGAVRFGSIGSLAANAASTILQNEQYNTLLIDGVISGGRTYKARNHVERAEIVFREVTLILFLYFAQAQIQNGINKGFGKLLKIPASLGFKDLQYIKKKADHDPSFLETFKKDEQAIRKSMEGFLEKKVKGEQFGRVALLENSEHRTEALLKTIHQYFLKERNLAKNLVFETAIESGLIPTFKEQVGNSGFWEQMKVIGKELNPAAEKNLTHNPFLDLSKKINTSGVHDLQKSMSELTEKVTQKELPHMLNQVMRLRAGSLLASNVACFAALSIIFPEIQHWITYKMTGKDYFPGIQKGEQPLPVKPMKVG